MYLIERGWFLKGGGVACTLYKEKDEDLDYFLRECSVLSDFKGGFLHGIYLLLFFFLKFVQVETQQQ